MKTLPIFTFWIGVGLFILGLGITFYPGAETNWFAAAAILCTSGFFIRKRTYRIATIFLVGISVTYCIWGYQRGKEYENWLSNQSPPDEKMQEILKYLDEPQVLGPLE